MIQQLIRRHCMTPFLLLVIAGSSAAFAPEGIISRHRNNPHRAIVHLPKPLSTRIHAFPVHHDHHHHQPIAYKHLFRHYHDISFDSWLRCVEPPEFLASVGFSSEQISTLLPKGQQSEGPWMVHDQLAPKVRLLVEAIPGGGTGQLAWKKSVSNSDSPLINQRDDSTSTADNNIMHSLRLSPLAIQRICETPEFLDSSRVNVDRTVGPYLAYWHNNHHSHSHAHPSPPVGGSSSLLENAQQWAEFVQACALPKRTDSLQAFCDWCNHWEEDDDNDTSPHQVHTVQDIEEWIHGTFCPGLMHATQHLDKEAQNRIIPLLLCHGHNPFQSSSTTTSSILPLHGAAGTGALQAVQALVNAYMVEGGETEEETSLLDIMTETCEAKHGATPFHWACAGLHPHQEGAHRVLHQQPSENDLTFESSYDVCRWMLQEAGPDDRHEFVNLPTWKGDTPLFWAAWAGQMANTELLLIHGANPLHTNNEQQTALHWAAGAGHVAICQALVDEGGLSFLNWEDAHGQTALDYAREHGHGTVVQWITAVQYTLDMRSNSTTATALP